MSKHPQQHTSTGSVVMSQTSATVPSQHASPGAPPAAPKPADAPAQLAAPTQFAGIISGPGNQGTANTANLMGHAGTAAGFGSIPRQLKVGQSGSKPA